MAKKMVKKSDTKYLKMSPEEVETILKVKYNVPQEDIDFLDHEFRLRLLEDLQSTPMLNEKI